MEIKKTPITELLDIIVDNRGKSVPTVEMGIPLIATNCIKTSSIFPTFENIRFVSPEVHANWFRSHLMPGDILFVNKGTPGRVCLVPDPVEFCAAQDMIAFRVNENKIGNRFLFAVLRSDYIQKTIANFHVGLVIPHFKKGDLKNILIPRFNLKKESFIGDFYYQLSFKIELNNRINAELESMAKLIYDYWFVQFDFPDENGKPYKSSGGKMVYNEELKREIPEGWEIVSLVNYVDLQYGFPFKTALFNNEMNGVPVVRIRDIVMNTISSYSTEEVDIKYALNKGDLLIGMDGNFHLNFWDKDDCYLNQRCVRIRKNSPSDISLFQVLFSIEPYIKAREKNVSRTTVGHLSAKDINSLSLIIPPQKTLEKSNGLFDDSLEKIIANRNENRKLEELRDWLLPMLMNGQVTIKD